MIAGSTAIISGPAVATADEKAGCTVVVLATIIMKKKTTIIPLDLSLSLSELVFLTHSHGLSE